jgi:transposase-like protein
MAQSKKRKAGKGSATIGARRAMSIPLDNIGGAPSLRANYSADVKKKAVAMVMAGKSHGEVAEELRIVNSSIIGKWMSIVKAGGDLGKRGGGLPPANSTKSAPNFAAGLRASLDGAARERDERLEAAALIVEADAGGRDGADLAKRIRTFKRPANKST